MNIGKYITRAPMSPMKAGSFGMIAILAGLTSLAPLSIDSILPAIPTFIESLDATPAQAQWTISFFLLGFGGGHLVWGLLADRYGRRPVALLGLVIFILATIGCALSESIEVITILRVVQGLAGAAMSVVCRAIIRDLFDRETGARILSLTLLMMNLAPILAPILGGYLLMIWSWQSIFIITGVVTLVVSVAFFLRVDETLDPARRRPLRPAAIISSYWSILRNRTCFTYMLLNACAFSGFFAYLTGSPLVFVEIYGYSENEYGYLFALTAGSLMLANITNSRLLKRFKSSQMLRVGAIVLACGGIAVAIVMVGRIHDIRAFIGAVMIYVFGAGLIFPNAVAAGLEPVGALAGTAAALIGAMQLLTGTMVSAIVARAYDGTTMPIGVTMAFMAVLVTIIYKFLIPRERATAVET